MGLPLSVPHVAPLDSQIGEWDRRCRVCSHRTLFFLSFARNIVCRRVLATSLPPSPPPPPAVVMATAIAAATFRPSIFWGHPHSCAATRDRSGNTAGPPPPPSPQSSLAGGRRGPPWRALLPSGRRDRRHHPPYGKRLRDIQLF